MHPARRLLPAHHPFSPRLVDALKGYDRHRFLADLGAGLTVGVVALPLAMAFAIASGVKPEQGLFTAIIAGLLISLLGGSSVQIGGPAGAFIVIVYGIVQRHGVANLLTATMLAGMVLFAMGWLRLGALVRQIPVSIVAGFTNGIAVLIALSQVKDLLGLPIASMPAGFVPQVEALAAHAAQANLQALALGGACVVGLLAWSRLTAESRFFPADRRARRWLQVATRIPGPVVALVSLTLLAAGLGLQVETIGSRFGGIPQALPRLERPALSWAGVQALFIPTLTIAVLGAIESLLCARVADNLSPLRRHDPNQELMAQGIANVVAPLFGGIPATGTIARTVTNIRAGATSPVAGVVHALTLLAIVLVAAPLAGRIPLAVLAGILMFVAWNMMDWREFVRLGRHGLEPRAKFLCTFALTVVLDLTVAVEVGLVLACVLFVYRMSRLFELELDATVDVPAGVRVYRVYGSLFFGAAGRLERLADDVPAGTRAVVLDAHHLVSIDSSGLDALDGLQRDLERLGVRLAIAGLHRQPLEAAGGGLARGAGAGPVIAADVPSALAAFVAPEGRPA
jgi:SulP family sulfate permease